MIRSNFMAIPFSRVAGQKNGQRASNTGSCTKQHGYALVPVLLIVMIVSIMGIGSMSLSHVSEKSAGNSIQRSRAFQAADGGASIAENTLEALFADRVFADSTASEGVFSKGSYTEKWWRTPNYTGEQVVDETAILGVAQPPRYIVEEIGQYVSDGGTGIANLDLGSSTYGSRSKGGRDVVLYRIESQGTGSFNEVQSVVESLAVYSY